MELIITGKRLDQDPSQSLSDTLIKPYKSFLLIALNRLHGNPGKSIIHAQSQLLPSISVHSPKISKRSATNLAGGLQSTLPPGNLHRRTQRLITLQFRRVMQAPREARYKIRYRLKRHSTQSLQSLAVLDHLLVFTSGGASVSPW